MEPSPPIAGDELFCPECGYNLRVAADRCSECGLSLAFLTAPEAGIPWSHRRTRGRIRTFWATVWLALFRLRVLAREVFRPVDMRDARRFHAVALALLLGGLLAALTLILLSPANVKSRAGVALLGREEATGNWYAALIGGFGHATVWAWLLALAAGVLSAVLCCAGGTVYLFQPRRLPLEQQRRAIALSYYAAAPMAIAGPLMIAAVLVGLHVGPLTQRDEQAIVALLAVAGLCMAAVWLLLVRLARRVLRTAGAVLCVALVTPLIWLLGGGLAFAIGGVVALYVAIVVNSLA